MVTHFDRCLGCMACVTACPSGVRYDRLIERVRPQIERHHERPRAERALRRLLFGRSPTPAGCARWRRCWRRRAARRRPLAAPARAAGEGRPPAPRPGDASQRSAGAHTRGRRRRAAASGCCSAACSACSTRRSTAPRSRCSRPRASRCSPRELPVAAARSSCTPARRRPRVARARATIAAFAALGELDHVVVNAAGCGSAMKEYGELLGTAAARAFAARVRDVTELLAAVAAARAARRRCRCASPTTTPATSPTPRASARSRGSCCAAIPGARAARGRRRARALLRLGRDLQPLQPEAAAELGERKARHLLETGADAIAAGNPGCGGHAAVHPVGLFQELARPQNLSAVNTSGIGQEHRLVPLRIRT